MSAIYENAIDSLRIGMEFFLKETSYSSRKHAILTVFRAIELLLKERLAQTNPILIYKNIDAKITDDAQTVGIREALTRSCASQPLTNYPAIYQGFMAKGILGRHLDVREQRAFAWSRSLLTTARRTLTRWTPPTSRASASNWKLSAKHTGRRLRASPAPLTAGPSPQCSCGHG
jgi:hypothetical protein